MMFCNQYLQFQGSNNSFKLALYVLAHAYKQRKRKKNLAALLPGMNAREAYRWALSEAAGTVVVPSVGSDVHFYLRFVSEAVRLTGFPKPVTFNGTSFVVHVGDSAEDAIKRWNEKVEEQQRAYETSPEGIAAQKRREENRLKCQQHIADMMIALRMMEKKVDYTVEDLQLLLQWLCELEKAAIIGIEVPYDEILMILRNLGFVSRANCGEKYNDDDHDNVARYIIGQSMSCMETSEPPYQVIHHFVGDWTEKFSSQSV